MMVFKQNEPGRFDTNPNALLSSKEVLFPVTISVRRGSFTDAFTTTKETLTKLIDHIKVLTVGNIDIQSDRIRFDDETKGNVLAQMSCVVSVKLKDEDIWIMMEAVAKILDVINKYALPGGSGKDVQIYSELANVVVPK